MVAKNLLDTVLSLPILEQVELLQRLRESLHNDPRLSPLSEEHKHILDQRLVDFENDPLEGSTWEDVETRILAKLGGP